MDYSFLQKWLNVANKLDAEDQRMFFLYLATYAATGEEIPTNKLVEIASAPFKADIDEANERKRYISQKRSEASYSRTNKRGGRTTNNNKQQQTTTNADFAVNNQENNKQQQTTATTANADFVDKNSATDCNIDGYKITTFATSTQNSENSPIYNIYNNNLDNNNINLSKDKENDIYGKKEKKEGEGEKKESPKPKMTPEEKKQDMERRKQEFYNRLIPYVEEYGKGMIRRFFDYWSDVRDEDKNYRMFFELEKRWSTAGRLRTWKQREDSDLQKQQLKLQNNAANRQFTQSVNAETEEAKRQREHNEFIERLTKQADEEMRRIQSNAQYDGVQTNLLPR